MNHCEHYYAGGGQIDLITPDLIIFKERFLE